MVLQEAIRYAGGDGPAEGDGRGGKYDENKTRLDNDRALCLAMRRRQSLNTNKTATSNDATKWKIGTIDRNRYIMTHRYEFEKRRRMQRMISMVLGKRIAKQYTMSGEVAQAGSRGNCHRTCADSNAQVQIELRKRSNAHTWLNQQGYGNKTCRPKSAR